MFFVSQVAVASVDDITHLWIASAVLGLAYGCVFSLFPTVCLEWFGMRKCRTPPQSLLKHWMWVYVTSALLWELGFFLHVSCSWWILLPDIWEEPWRARQHSRPRCPKPSSYPCKFPSSMLARPKVLLGQHPPHHGRHSFRYSSEHVGWISRNVTQDKACQWKWSSLAGWGRAMMTCGRLDGAIVFYGVLECRVANRVRQLH